LSKKPPGDFEAVRCSVTTAEEAYRGCATLLAKTMTLSQSRKKIARNKTIATTIKKLSSMSRL
jgi:hypothetical protein